MSQDSYKPPQIVAAMEELPKAFRNLCAKQAVVTAEQAVDLLNNLRFVGANILDESGLNVDDLDQVDALLPTITPPAPAVRLLHTLYLTNELLPEPLVRPPDMLDDNVLNLFGTNSTEVGHAGDPEEANKMENEDAKGFKK